MLFSTWQFILAFLPISFFVYFFLNKRRMVVGGKVWLLAASLFFYSYWNVTYLPLMLASILVNFVIGSSLSRAGGTANPNQSKFPPKVVLAAGITINLVVLAYYKYTDFLVANINAAIGAHISLPHIVLPLAVSFFTFTQIAYLVDSYRGETAEYDLLNYALFVTFFPHLIAGPIVHHRHIMSQFSSKWTLAIRHSNVLKGLILFSIGFFKKSVIADTFSIWADAGFDSGQALDFFSAWAASLSYTFQLYFDFSGYCDMAMGASLLFNIWLPLNFNSPYKARDIQDFWRRWHITLSGFLRDYLYIPLGGNRGTPWHTYRNILVTFVLGGLWHGASWMFVAWGALHGAALVVHRLWKKLGCALPNKVAWLITFLFVNFTWVFFRAKTPEDAKRVLHGMIDINSISLPASSVPALRLSWAGWLADYLLPSLPASLVAALPSLLAIGAGLMLLPFRNSYELVAAVPTMRKSVAAAVIFAVAMYFSLGTTSPVFLYFNF